MQENEEKLKQIIEEQNFSQENLEFVLQKFFNHEVIL